MKSEVISVLDEATPLLTVDGSVSYEMSALILNNGSETLYVGGEDVTTANGFPIAQGAIPLAVDTVLEDLYGIVAVGPLEVRVLRRGI